MSQQLHLRLGLTTGLVALVAATSLIFADRSLAAATLAQPPAKGVTQKADDVEPPASLKSGIPIWDSEANAEAHPLVVYSVNASGLQAGEKLRIEGSTHMSYCNNSDIKGSGNPGSPCRTLTGRNGPTAGPPDPYDYTVQLEMHVYQAGSASDRSSAADSGATCGQTKDCADWLTYTHRDLPCTHDVHHCSFTVKNTDAVASGAGSFINVEVVAWAEPTDPQAGQWERGQAIELEGDCINDTSYSNCSPQPNDDQRTRSKGQLSVVRVGPEYSPESNTVKLFSSETKPTRSLLDINTSGRSSPQVVYSKPIKNVEQGDVIEAQLGRIDLDGTRPCDDGDGIDEPGDYCTPNPNYAFNHDVQLWWLLANDARHAQAANSGERYVSGNNQQNCWKLDDFGNAVPYQCRMQQLGAVTVPKPPRNHTMYLNLVAVAKDSTGQSDPDGGSPKLKLSNDGEFDLRCDPITWPDPNLQCGF